MATYTQQSTKSGAVLLSQRAAAACIPATESWGVRTLSQQTVVKLQKESRPYPTDLLASMTARAAQSITTANAKVETVYDEQTSNCGSQGGVIHPTLITKTYTIPGAPAVSLTPPDWETAMRLKIKSEAVNLADAIGEYREACAMFGSSVGVLTRASRVAWQLTARGKWKSWRLWARYLVHGSKPKNRMEAYDMVAGYLAIQFGIKPTVGLIFDSIEKIEYMSLQGVRRAYSVSRTTDTETSLAGSKGGEWKVRTKYNVRAKAYVILDPNNGRFTAGNLAEALWAGTRLSFMVDWFLDVGSYLSALDALSGVRSMSVCVTHRTLVDARDGTNVALPASTRKRVVAPGRYRKVSHRREVLGTVPLPRAPQWKPSPSWGKVASSVAVLLSLRRNSSG